MAFADEAQIQRELDAFRMRGHHPGIVSHPRIPFPTTPPRPQATSASLLMAIPNWIADIFNGRHNTTDFEYVTKEHLQSVHRQLDEVELTRFHTQSVLDEMRDKVAELSDIKGSINRVAEELVSLKETNFYVHVILGLIIGLFIGFMVYLFFAKQSQTIRILDEKMGTMDGKMTTFNAALRKLPNDIKDQIAQIRLEQRDSTAQPTTIVSGDTTDIQRQVDNQSRDIAALTTNLETITTTTDGIATSLGTLAWKSSTYKSNIVAEVNKAYGSLKKYVADLEPELKKVSNTTHDAKESQDALKGQLAALDGRLTALDTIPEVKTSQEKLQTKLEAVEGRLTELDKIQGIKESQAMLDGRFNTFESGLTGKVSGVATDVATLQAAQKESKQALDAAVTARGEDHIEVLEKLAENKISSDLELGNIEDRITKKLEASGKRLSSELATTSSGSKKEIGEIKTELADAKGHFAELTRNVTNSSISAERLDAKIDQLTNLVVNQNVRAAQMLERKLKGTLKSMLRSLSKTTSEPSSPSSKSSKSSNEHITDAGGKDVKKDEGTKEVDNDEALPHSSASGEPSLPHDNITEVAPQGQQKVATEGRTDQLAESTPPPGPQSKSVEERELATEEGAEPVTDTTKSEPIVNPKPELAAEKPMEQVTDTASPKVTVYPEPERAKSQPAEPVKDTAKPELTADPEPEPTVEKSTEPVTKAADLKVTADPAPEPTPSQPTEPIKDTAKPEVTVNLEPQPAAEKSKEPVTDTATRSAEGATKEGAGEIAEQPAEDSDESSEVGPSSNPEIENFRRVLDPKTPVKVNPRYQQVLQGGVSTMGAVEDEQSQGDSQQYKMGSSKHAPKQSSQAGKKAGPEAPVTRDTAKSGVTSAKVDPSSQTSRTVQAGSSTTIMGQSRWSKPIGSPASIPESNTRSLGFGTTGSALSIPASNASSLSSGSTNAPPYCIHCRDSRKKHRSEDCWSIHECQVCGEQGHPEGKCELDRECTICGKFTHNHRMCPERPRKDGDKFFKRDKSFDEMKKARTRQKEAAQSSAPSGSGWGRGQGTGRGGAKLFQGHYQ